MIKYLGSKRRLVPVLSALCRAAAARTALDLFCGTTRVAQAFKSEGADVTAVDSARYAEVFARCYIATDRDAVDLADLEQLLDRLDRLPGRPGYVSDVFCRRSRFFQLHNGARIDAVRHAIDRDWAGSPLEPVLLTSLIEAADRVDSTTGVQMAYVKQWAQRSHQRLALRRPVLLPGPGRAVRGDASILAANLGSFDLAYLDPPYNQHRYTANYHVWETLVAWDAPEPYGVACKRSELADPASTSVFNRRRLMPAALRDVITAVPARVLVVSFSNEGWVGLDDLVSWCGVGRDEVAVLAFDSRRYVGAQIGVHDPSGRRVGEVSHLRNIEYLLIAGAADEVRAMTAAAADAADAGGLASPARTGRISGHGAGGRRARA
jgi:adenine-specific DNA-methyltransferase